MGSGCWTRWQREGKEQEDGLGVRAHRDDTGPWRPVTEFLLWSLVMGRVGTDGSHLYTCTRSVLSPAVLVKREARGGWLLQPTEGAVRHASPCWD